MLTIKLNKIILPTYKIKYIINVITITVIIIFVFNNIIYNK